MMEVLAIARHYIGGPWHGQALHGSETFDREWYLQSNPDVAAAAK